MACLLAFCAFYVPCRAWCLRLYATVRFLSDADWYGAILYAFVSMGTDGQTHPGRTIQSPVQSRLLLPCTRYTGALLSLFRKNTIPIDADSYFGGL